MSPVQLTLSSERSRNECALAKNSNADPISEPLLHCLSTNWCSAVFRRHSQTSHGDFPHNVVGNMLPVCALRSRPFYLGTGGLRTKNLCQVV